MNPIIFYRLYRFNRRCGYAFGVAIKKAFRTAMRP